MKFRKRFWLFTILFVMAILLVGCKQKVDWDEVNAALNEEGLYHAKSLKEAEEIVGYRVPTVDEVPPGFTAEPDVLVSKLNKFEEDSPLEVHQFWKHKDGRYQGIFELHVSPYRIQIGGPTKQVTINGYPGESQLLEDASRPPLLTLAWSDGELHYKLLATLADNMDESMIHELAESIK